MKAETILLARVMEMYSRPIKAQRRFEIYPIIVRIEKFLVHLKAFSHVFLTGKA